MTRAYVGLGSNLGDRQASLELALGAFPTFPSTTLRRCSRIYDSEPVGPGEQGRYLNAVAELETALPARALLHALLETERRAGRVRTQRWGPRTLDLDLLLYGAETIDEPGLCVPHPRITERDFVLEPLAELVPCHKIGGRSISAWAQSLRNCSTIRLWRQI